MAGVLCHQLPQLVEGDGDGWLVIMANTGEVKCLGQGCQANAAGCLLGPPGLPQSLKLLQDEIEPGDPRQLGIQCGSSDGMMRELAGVLGGDADRYSDALVGRVCSNGRTSTLLVIGRNSGNFSLDQCRAFDGVLLTARAMSDRLAAGNVEKQFQNLYLGSPPAAHAAVFVLHENGETLPVNFQAIQAAEKWWGDDQAFGKVDPAAMRTLRESLDAGWSDPVTATFVSVVIRFATGTDIKFLALYRYTGDVILVHFPNADAVSGDAALSAVLTRRQKEIMEWIAEGKTSAEVAIILNISPRTVEKHLEAVFQRLGVENRIAAVRRYLDLKTGSGF